MGMQVTNVRQHRHLGVYGLVRCEGKVLLIKKGRGPYNGMYDLPGGGVEFGETPEQTLRREFMEETGLVVEPLQLLAAVSNRVQYVNSSLEVEDLHHLGILYVVELAPSEDLSSLSEGPDGQDSLGAVWLDEEQLRGVQLSPFAERAIRAAALAE
jgi:ADP-ribose pyrophosphatase YjhB (NUDIX family)